MFESISQNIILLQSKGHSTLGAHNENNITAKKVVENLFVTHLENYFRIIKDWLKNDI